MVVKSQKWGLASIKFHKKFDKKDRDLDMLKNVIQIKVSNLIVRGWFSLFKTPKYGILIANIGTLNAKKRHFKCQKRSVDSGALKMPIFLHFKC